MEDNPVGVYDVINDVIEDLTTTGSKDLNEANMKVLKSHCKDSPKYVTFAFHLLMEQLRKEHSEIRYSTVQIIHELFTRSHTFRTLILFELQNLFLLTMETEPNSMPSPPPLRVADSLKTYALRVYYEWYQKFGNAYRKLELGYEFLKYVKKVRFTEPHNLTLEQREKEKKEKRREERIRKSKLEQVDIQFRDCCHDIKTNVKQLENCFELILPKVESFTNKTDESNENLKSNGSSLIELFSDEKCTFSQGETGSETGIHKNYSLAINIPTRLSIDVTPDNTQILQRTKELHKEITSQLTNVKRWLHVLVKCQSTDKDLIETVLKLKNKMVGLLNQYDELDIKTTEEKINKNESSNEESFIDVPEVNATNAQLNQSTTAQCNSTNQEKTSPSLSCKEKLLKLAPVVPYDKDLQYWGQDNITVPSSYKFDSLHRFWKPTEHEESFVPPQLDEGINTRTSYFLSEAQPITRKCGAALPNNLTCQRMDRLKCPFHGKIVERDSFGRALDPGDIKRDVQRKRENEKRQRETIQKEIDAALGTNLSSIKKRRKKETRADISKSRYARLTKVNHQHNKVRKIEKKIFSSRAIKRANESISRSTRQLQDKKFASDFNYLN